MAVALVDVWHKKTGAHTRLPKSALPHWDGDYTTTKPAAVKAAEKREG